MVEATRDQGLGQVPSHQTGLRVLAHLEILGSTADTITRMKQGQGHLSEDSQMTTETGAVTDVGLQSRGRDAR